MRGKGGEDTEWRSHVERSAVETMQSVDQFLSDNAASPIGADTAAWVESCARYNDDHQNVPQHAIGTFITYWKETAWSASSPITTKPPETRSSSNPQRAFLQK